MPTRSDLFDAVSGVGYMAWSIGIELSVVYAGVAMYILLRGASQQAQAAQRARNANLALRLRLLQGQLEPHFLSSIIDSIGVLIAHEQRSAATRALASLSDLLRSAIRASQLDAISVADELDFVRDYLALHALCGARAPRLDGAPGATDWSGYACPPLLLLPLVEQLIAQAGAPEGTLELAVALDLATLRITLGRESGAPPLPSTALAGTRERLSLLYGQAAALRQADGADAPRLVLHLPIRELDDEQC